ncbi:MAG: FAD-binding protein [Alphaproteobacteria bacterium]|nr:FAD-binding protein [Alphaproteobacteria bacterium]
MTALAAAGLIVVGAGPAGLAAARAATDAGVARVLVIERDDEAGGLPRFCHHPGFGWEYSYRFESGPGFIRRLLGALDRDRVQVLTRTTALALRPGPEIDIVGPACGAVTLKPQAIVLATGIRERPRAARLVPGRRPERGVLTTGQLQQMVARGVPVAGRRAVVIGTEHVAFSVLLTARRAGLQIVAMVDERDRVMSFPLLGMAVRHALGVPIHLATRVLDISGESRVDTVTLNGPAGVRRIACDTVIFTGEFVPDAPLARAGGVALDPRTAGPAVDQLARTNLPGVFAAGNVLRAVESSGFCAIEGASAGAAAAAFVRRQTEWNGTAAPIGLGTNLLYMVPQRWAFEPARQLLPASLRTRIDLDRARVLLRHGDEIVWQSLRRSLLRQRRIRIDLAGLPAGLRGTPRVITVDAVT